MQPEVLQVVAITHDAIPTAYTPLIPSSAAQTTVVLQSRACEFLCGAQVVLYFATNDVPFEYGKAYTLSLTPVEVPS